VARSFRFSFIKNAHISLRSAQVRSYISKSDSSVGVVRIKSFSTTTQDIVTDQINELKKKGAKNILFDLRGNPGGSLQGGVDTGEFCLRCQRKTAFSCRWRVFDRP